MVTGASFLWVDWPGQEVDNWPPFSAQVSNDWIYTSPTIRLHGAEKYNLTLSRLLMLHGFLSNACWGSVLGEYSRRGMKLVTCCHTAGL